MVEIINEFFSKECKIKNITIEELLIEYRLHEREFWSYVYSYDLQRSQGMANRIRRTNEVRKNNRKSLEVYCALKDSNYQYTFGDLARSFDCSIDKVIELLSSKYLTQGILNYSFEKLQENNMKLLRGKEEFQLYFYFLEHDVTLQELAEKFDKNEEYIQYYVKEFLKTELSAVQIQNLMQTNYAREANRVQWSRKENISTFFLLTSSEIQKIDCLIATIEQKLISEKAAMSLVSGKNVQQLKQNIEITKLNLKILTIIKHYLSNPYISLFDVCSEYHIAPRRFKNCLSSPLLYRLLSPEILAKLDIKMQIHTKKIYQHADGPSNKIVKQYLESYGLWLNQDNKTLEYFSKEIGTDLTQIEKLDQKFHTCIFSKITDSIQNVQKSRKKLEIYYYYLEHFVLLRDLSSIFSMTADEIDSYFQNISSIVNIDKIAQIEENRLKRLHYASKQLSNFARYLQTLQKIDSTEDFSEVLLEDMQLLDFIKDKITVDDLCKDNRYQLPYIQKMIRSCQFMAIYILQDRCDTKELAALFDIRSSSTTHDYLHHPIVQKLISAEIQEYIDNKRTIASSINRKENYQNLLTHDEKGQFVRKAEKGAN